LIFRDHIVPLLLILSCLLFGAAVLPAQTNNFVESWQLYEQGKAQLDDPDGPELGEALLSFQEAIDKRGGNFPEAEMAIGDIYFQEGAFALAKRQYEKAYELRKGMEIAEEKFSVLYRLAHLHEVQEQYGDLERYLLQVLEEQPYFWDESYGSFRDAFVSTYLEKGLDHLFKLYRMEGVAFSVPAHAKLGWLYYRTGRSSSAILQSLFALDIMVTESVKELRRVQPGFVFTTMEAFLDSALERDNIRQYLVSEEFFKTLYYLATASYAASRPGLAEPIWRLLATYPLESVGPAATTYAELASRQLKSPWLDPYINPSVRKIEYPIQQ
jgi:tetratricopeptide (TPR) repeat protein